MVQQVQVFKLTARGIRRSAALAYRHRLAGRGSARAAYERPALRRWRPARDGAREAAGGTL
jgi:hypothetical protein